MPTIKIGEVLPVPQCMHWDHNPPMHKYREPGRYRHTCPSCGKVTEFEVKPPNRGWYERRNDWPSPTPHWCVTETTEFFYSMNKVKSFG